MALNANLCKQKSIEENENSCKFNTYKQVTVFLVSTAGAVRLRNEMLASLEV